MFTRINKQNAVFLKDMDAFKKIFSGLADLKTWIRQKFGN
jgi:hypothetical protein